MVFARGHLWLATVDELGTVGTGFVRVDPASGEVQQLGGLDRAATLAADGNLVWVRGQSLLQTRSAVTGEVVGARTDLGFGWVAAHDGHAWTTDRESSTVESLDGVTTAERREVPGDELLERPAWFRGRLFVAHGRGLDVLDPTSLGRVGRIETGAQHPGLLVSTADSLFALLDNRSPSSAEPARLLRYVGESDQAVDWQLGDHESFTTFAVVDAHTVVACTTGDTCHRYRLTSP
jgi:hypothetical protein